MRSSALPRAFLLLGLALAGAAPARADNPSWVGKQVIFKSNEDHYFGHCDEKGRVAKDFKSGVLDTVVVKQQGEWVRIREGDREGWLPRDQVLPAEEAIPYFTQVFARAADDGERVRALNARGTALEHVGRMEEAIQDYNRMVELVPDLSFVHTNRGSMLLHAGEYKAALADFEEAIRLMGDKDPTWRSNCYGQSGWIKQRRGQQQAALDDYAKAIELAPRTSNARAARGGLWVEAGDHAKASADFDKAIEFNPKNSAGYGERGLLRMVQKDYPAARADFDQATRYAYLMPPYHFLGARVYRNHAWFLATCPEEKYRDGARAARLARKACELTFWKDGDCLDALAAACAEAGKYSEAADWEGKALARPDFEGRRGAGARERLRLYREGKPFRQP